MNQDQGRRVVAIGNFDGVHRGHACLLFQARAMADAAGLDLAVLTFEPHPRRFFDPKAAPFRLTLEAAKRRRFEALGVDAVDVAAFDADFAAMSAQDFIDRVIVGRMRAAHVVVGEDFHFGHKRGGNVAMLAADGRFTLSAVALEAFGGEVVSSTRIREALLAGDLEAAAQMLGWPWEIESTVVHGDKRGRTIGYPTANIELGETLCPAHGIYAVWVDIGDGAWRAGVASLGVRPMFALEKPLLEVFLPDYEGDLYGRVLRVVPARLLRPEAVFEDIESLKIQIGRDVADARTVLRDNPFPFPLKLLKP